MAGEQADNVCDDIDAAMRKLRESMRGIPTRSAGFKSEHDSAARAVAYLTVLITDARMMFSDSSK